jgi:hypothetical protein
MGVTKFQSLLVGVGLIVVGVGLSLFGWIAHTPEAVSLGALCFGIGIGALGLKRPQDA